MSATDSSAARLFAVAACALLALGSAPNAARSAPAERLVVGLLNLEDEHSDVAHIADAVLARGPAVDVWAFTEFTGGAAELEAGASRAAGGVSFDSAAATQGGTQKTLVLWNARRFEEVDRFHLGSMEMNGAVPFGVRLRALDGGPGLIVVTENAREKVAQAFKPLARSLNDWVKGRAEPVIVAGDFGFSMPPDRNKSHEAFELLTADGALRWIAPEPLGPTACDGKRVDDLLLLGGRSDGWGASAEVLFRDDQQACRPEDRASDHRALIATFVW